MKRSKVSKVCTIRRQRYGLENLNLWQNLNSNYIHQNGRTDRAKFFLATHMTPGKVCESLKVRSLSNFFLSKSINVNRRKSQKFDKWSLEKQHLKAKIVVQGTPPRTNQIEKHSVSFI